MVCTQESKVEHTLRIRGHFIFTDIEDLCNVGNNCMQEKLIEVSSWNSKSH